MKAIYCQGDAIRHFADSSMQRNNQPWFMPADGREWAAAVMPAVRITRLGMHIAPKFAGRYYDAICAVCIFVPAVEAANIGAAGELIFLRDNALCVGEGIAMADAPLPFVIAVNGVEIQASIDTATIDRAISSVSDICTLKTGDIIIPSCGDAIVTPLAEGGELTVTTNGHPSINLRIR